MIGMNFYKKKQEYPRWWVDLTEPREDIIRGLLDLPILSRCWKWKYSIIKQVLYISHLKSPDKFDLRTKITEATAGTAITKLCAEYINYDTRYSFHTYWSQTSFLPYTARTKLRNSDLEKIHEQYHLSLQKEKKILMTFVNTGISQIFLRIENMEIRPAKWDVSPGKYISSLVVSNVLTLYNILYTEDPNILIAVLEFCPPCFVQQVCCI